MQCDIREVRAPTYALLLTNTSIMSDFQTQQCSVFVFLFFFTGLDREKIAITDELHTDRNNCAGYFVT